MYRIGFLSSVFIYFFCFPTLVICQTPLDSLKGQLEFAVDKLLKADLLMEISKIEARTKPDSALVHVSKALTYLGPEDVSIRKSKLLTHQAAVHNLLGNIKETRASCMAALRIAKSHQLDLLCSSCYTRLGILASGLNENQQAKLYLDSAIQILDTLDNKLVLGITLNTMGSLLMKQSKYNDALVCFQRFLSIAEALNHPALTNTARQNIAGLYIQIKKPELAIPLFEEALQATSSRNRPSYKTSMLTNLGLAYTSIGQFNKSLSYLKRAEQNELEHEGSNKSLGDIYYAMAENFIKQKLIQKALDNYNKTLSHLDNNKNDRSYVLALAGTGNCYPLLGKAKLGLETLKRGLELAKKNNYPDLTADILNKLYKLQQNQGLYAQALHSHIEYRVIHDSILNQDKVIELTETRLNFDFAKKQLADSLLHLQEVTTQKLLLDRKQRQQWGLGFGSLMLLFLAGALYKAYRDKSKANRIIAEEKNEVEVQKLRAEQSESKLQELDSIKTRLYHNITHEFRTPLTVIQGIAQQHMNEPELTSGKDLEMIVRNSQNLTFLVNQILDLSKLESGNMPIHKIQDDIVVYIKYLIESIQSYAEIKKINVLFESENPEIIMDFDPEKIKKILINLLSNAIKFTPSFGQVKVNTAIIYTKRDSIKNRLLFLSIKDSGKGVPKDKLPYIFDRFYQVDDSTTRTTQGTGIGLALVKELVKLSGGNIVAKSNDGGGTTFEITLPISTNAKKIDAELYAPSSDPMIIQSVASPSPSTIEKSISTDLPLLLLVEDNDDIVSYMISIFQDKYTTIVAKNGQEGISQAIEHTPDLVISDVMMPIKDGHEVCKTLKEDHRTSHIPVIMLTAKADTDSKIEGLRYGADDYLIKPFHEEELLTRIDNLLRLRKKLQQSYLLSISQSTATNSPVLPNREHAFLIKVRAIVQSNLTDSNFTAEVFCAEVGMSLSQLQRKLTALTNLSPNRYIRQVRLLKAKELLKRDDLNIKEVGYRVGINDPSYFSRIFKKEFNLSPLEWKKSL